MLLRELTNLNALKEDDGQLSDRPSDSDFPKVVGKAGDFIIELNENEQIAIKNTSGKVLLTMPNEIWKQLKRS